MGLELPYAFEMPYWRTGKSSPDVWIDRTKNIIEELGGKDISEMFGSSMGRGAYMLQWSYEGEAYRAIWPVLQTRNSSEDQAARVQAATMLYHDCKSAALKARVLGHRAAFFWAILLPDGRTASQLATPLLTEQIQPLRLT